VLLNGADISEINAALVQNGFKVRSMTPEQDWLDRLFLEFTTNADPAIAKSHAAAEVPS
jgi:hypothetical protein